MVEMSDDAMARIAWCEKRIETLNHTLRNMVEYFGMQYTGEEDEFYAGDEKRKL
jgi:hypothetical protein